MTISGKMIFSQMQEAIIGMQEVLAKKLLGTDEK